MTGACMMYDELGLALLDMKTEVSLLASAAVLQFLQQVCVYKAKPIILCLCSIT